MDHRWIIDVLADLRTFAQGNDLPQLAGELEGTMVVAAVEITRETGAPQAAVSGDTVSRTEMIGPLQQPEAGHGV